MDDLISRKRLLDVLRNIPDIAGLGLEPVIATQTAIELIEIAPAVDAVPVVHARWTTERTWTHDGEWYCSACEYEPVVFMDTAFCPNCGAKMDGERRNDA